MAVGVELHLGEDEGDLQRMEDVGLAGGAELAVMVLRGEFQAWRMMFVCRR